MDKVFFIIPDGENPFFISIGTLLQRKLSFSNKSLIVLSSDNSIVTELENIKIVAHESKDNGVDGLVFISSGANVESYEMVEGLIETESGGRKLPVVIVDREVVHPEKYKCNILCNNASGAFMAVEYLKEMGHTNIGIVKGLENTDPAAARYHSFVEACRRQELNLDSRWIFKGDFTFLSGRQAASSFMGLPQDERPTAIFCANDLSAAGFIQAVNELGMNVPDDVSVMGFDGSPLSRWLNPTLSTIVQPIDRIAEHVEYALFFDDSNEAGRELSRVMWVEPTLARRRSVRRIEG